MELACRLMYGEERYRQLFAENRERILGLALEPARTRPPLEVLQTEQAMAEAAHQKNVIDYETARARIRKLRWFMTLAPIVETLCALLIVAMASGWERWAVCILITAGWWTHKMEHHVPGMMADLESVPYPERGVRVEPDSFPSRFIGLSTRSRVRQERRSAYPVAPIGQGHILQ